MGKTRKKHLRATLTKKEIDLTGIVAVHSLRVEVVGGCDAGASFVADGERVTVGCARDNDLTLTDRAVSRYHLEFVCEDDGIHVTDLGSTNGTWLHDARIERAIVAAGTTFKVGESRLQVREADEKIVELHEGDTFGELRGGTQVMRRLMARLQTVADSDAAVLLVGESGTGKELAACALHKQSPRARGPFVTVDCGSLMPSLAASELFGHERGAFTGAHSRQIGAFERADGGTLFLDEVGELSAELQTQLLGVLDRRRFRRVGGQDDLHVDVRLISATNRDLRAEVNAGTFRLDLFYRLAVVRHRLPPLRERPDDIPLLVRHFLDAARCTLPLEQVVPEEMVTRFRTYRWPGNVRELRNVVEASLATGEKVRLSSLPPSKSTWTAGGALAPGLALGLHGLMPSEASLPSLDLPYGEAREEWFAAFQVRYLRRLLERADGNVSQAARQAQMDRSHLIKLLRRHNLK